MNDTNTGGPAFPVPGLYRAEYNNGMTLRDYFAAKAMVSILSQKDAHDGREWNSTAYAHDGREWNSTAWMSYQIADAMLKAREA